MTGWRIRRGAFAVSSVAALLLAARVVTRAVRRTFVAVEVAGISMRPALEPGDCLVVRRRRLPRDAFGRVVYLHAPAGRPMLKRVVGLPGESLRAGAHVEVNARRLDEPYASGESLERAYRGVNRLQPDEYFILGDHGAQSTDSRHFGPVRASAIEGVVMLRYWPPGRFGRGRRAHRALGPAVSLDDSVSV